MKPLLLWRQPTARRCRYPQLFGRAPFILRCLRSCHALPARLNSAETGDDVISSSDGAKPSRCQAHGHSTFNAFIRASFEQLMSDNRVGFRFKMERHPSRRSVVVAYPNDLTAAHFRIGVDELPKALIPPNCLPPATPLPFLAVLATVTIHGDRPCRRSA